MRGPTQFSAHWANEKANAEDFRGGWFHLGDAFVRNPDGSLDFFDRRKCSIKSGGENIYPAEIERMLLADPRMLEAVVVRQPDERWGEVPVVFIARYKLPKAVHFIGLDEFPRSTTGKVKRHEPEARLRQPTDTGATT